MSEKAHAVEVAVSAVASKTTYVSGGAALAAFFTSIESWVPWLGIGIALIGLLINLLFQSRRDRREREKAEREKAEHEAQLKLIQGKCSVKD